MADNKRWFKVWTSLLTDPEFDEIPNQSIGAWVRLGALVAQHGENGEITISKQQLLKRTNLNETELIDTIPSLLKINVEIRNSDNGTCFVSFKQWAKYQTDWNSYERLKKFRNTQNETKHETVQDKNKKRIRREENKNNNNYPDWLPLKEFSAYKEMRKTIRKHLTKKAEELAVEKLEKLKKEGHDPKLVLEQSTFNSWQGLFPLKADVTQQVKNVSLKCKYDNNKPCYKDCTGCELTGKGVYNENR